MALSIFDILVPGQILLDLSAVGVDDAIAATAGLLAGNPAVMNPSALTAEILSRERLSSTGMGNGIAFPHARSADLEQIVMAAARLSHGVEFFPGQEPVRLVFLIATPKHMVREYLGLVGDLARRLKQSAVRAGLLAAPSAAAFLAALGQGAPS